MFVPGKSFQPSITNLGKACQEQSSLLRKSVNYCRKKFYSTGPGAGTIKNYGRYEFCIKINQCLFLSALSTLVKYLQARPEPSIRVASRQFTIVRHFHPSLNVSGKVWSLPLRSMLEVIGRDKLSSQGILKGEVSLYHWPIVWLVWISLFCK